MPKQQYPEPTVGALILNPEGKLFLMRSHKWRDGYVIPGGHIELGERMEQALHREILEETGLKIHDVAWLCTQEFVYDDAFWKRRHFIFFDFTCRTGDTDAFGVLVRRYAGRATHLAMAMVGTPAVRGIQLPIVATEIFSIVSRLTDRKVPACSSHM